MKLCCIPLKEFPMLEMHVAIVKQSSLLPLKGQIRVFQSDSQRRDPQCCFYGTTYFANMLVSEKAVVPAASLIM